MAACFLGNAEASGRDVGGGDPPCRLGFSWDLLRDGRGRKKRMGFVGPGEDFRTMEPCVPLPSSPQFCNRVRFLSAKEQMKTGILPIKDLLSPQSSP